MLNADAFVNTQTFTEITADKAKCPYTHSPFKVLKNMSSKKKGKFFERMYEEYMSGQGFKVEKPENSDHDRKVNTRKKVFKGYFLWGDGTHFRWQQIRPDQDYDDVVFIAVYPDRVEFYEAEKSTVREAVEVQDEKGNWIYNQHGGKRVKSGTYFLDGFPSDFTWLKAV